MLADLSLHFLNFCLQLLRCDEEHFLTFHGSFRLVLAMLRQFLLERKQLLTELFGRDQKGGLRRQSLPQLFVDAILKLLQFLLSLIEDFIVPVRLLFPKFCAEFGP